MIKIFLVLFSMASGGEPSISEYPYEDIGSCVAAVRFKMDEAKNLTNDNGTMYGAMCKLVKTDGKDA